ncbi:MAG: type VI secretion system contractile sheath small subunit [Planctomycetes bacterium]|nr:type VI secretion system contractile sheath small subunit [Planctomycetota bacterium]
MAEQGSVAPKERVNITYKAAVGDATEEKELPFKSLVLADLTGRTDDTPVEERKAISVDKNNFNDVLESQKVTLAVNVDNKLDDEEGSSIGVNLSFETIKDFGPEAVADQIPEMKQLLELRSALAALKGPLGNYPNFRKQLQGLLADEGKQQQILGELGG